MQNGRSTESGNLSTGALSTRSGNQRNDHELQSSQGRAGRTDDHIESFPCGQNRPRVFHSLTVLQKFKDKCQRRWKEVSEFVFLAPLCEHNAAEIISRTNAKMIQSRQQFKTDPKTGLLSSGIL